MEEKTAIEYLTVPEGNKPSEIGEAVDILYQKYHSYKAIAQQLNVSPDFLSSRHRIFQLPKGIQWKIDQGQIGITQGHEISRLENEDDQWLLALAIIEEKLSIKECENVVNIVLKQNSSIRDALSVSAGVRFDRIQPLLLPLGFDIRLAICQSAWNQCKNWDDLCYELIRQGIDVDIKKIAIQLEALASDLREAGQEKTKP
jgi:hypothetical protein